MAKPYLELVEGSEIEGSVEVDDVGLDGISRPVHINQEMEFLQLTVKDARRLLNFLNEALPYMEGKCWEHN